jgi:hypothetical protein
VLSFFYRMGMGVNVIASHLLSWGQGRATADAAAGCHTVVLESASALPAVLASDFLGPASVVFAPGEQSRAGVVGYEGSFTDWEDEVSVGDDFFVQNQRYGVTPFLSVVGPTLVRISDTGDFEAFLADADQAWTFGVFAEHATHPLLQFADLPALGAGTAGDGPSLRLFVSAAGELSTSPCGRAIGRLGDGLDRLRAVWTELNAASAAPCSVCLASVVPEPVRTAGLATRPWLGRYLMVLDALREAKARGWGTTEVSGFRDQAGHDPAAPLLLTHDGITHLREPRSARTFKVGADARTTLEVLLVSDSAEAAVPELARRLGVSPAAARDAIGMVVAEVGPDARMSVR